ncbi:MAG TPA: hypothetical protein VMD29_12335 [Terracidiphilus sp.]|nr:hypothetical protein [Terracidiphilus sp.]
MLRISPVRVLACAQFAALVCCTGCSSGPAFQQDFSLHSDKTSLSLRAGGPSQFITISEAAANGFSAPISVAVSGLPTGITASPSAFTLASGATQQVAFSAGVHASSLSGAIQFQATSRSLQHTLTPPIVITLLSVPGTDEVTYHFDNARTGLNPNETILIPSKVKSSSFGLIRIFPADGLVDAQPLYLSNLTIAGKRRNVVYVVSEHDSVFAYDADSGALLWQKSVLGPGETTSDDHGCGQITPEIGITSTPVIDRAAGPHGTIFLVGMTLDAAGNYHQRLHALDIVTGAELPDSPAEIHATFPGVGANSTNGVVLFDPAQYAERAGLLLLNHVIYLGWTSHCDQDPYTGWLMGYSESTLAQTGVLNVTPNGSEGSIWMAGAGLAADTTGNIYFLDANGVFDTNLTSNGMPAYGDYGNGMIKVSWIPGVLHEAPSLHVTDYFEPYDTVSQSDNDSDVGSGGLIVLPDQLDAKGNVHHLVVGAGKNGAIYMADRDNMGKFNPNDNSNLYQEVDGVIGGAWCGPAYFNQTLYYPSVDSPIVALPFSAARLATSPTVQTANSFPYPGGTPAISSTGTANGIVWAVENNSPAVLHAYDARTLDELYNTNQAPNGRDNFGDGNKFITPAVVEGKVFVGTPSGVAEFGLLN